MRYGWTMDQIADMTVAQQLVALGASGDGRRQHFSTQAEYELWRMTRRG